eukprot:GHVT01024293.1.p1 GENE.GHVT01024293.1~~GHVT01024293.1.p1  ORF type:complete len:217 (-),score=25.96 GHVT01024293.1:81-731(-)
MLAVRGNPRKAKFPTSPMPALVPVLRLFRLFRLIRLIRPSPPHQALATAFPLEAEAPHNEARAATAQLQQDFEECLHEIAALNLKPSSRRLGIWSDGISSTCVNVLRVVLAAVGIVILISFIGRLSNSAKEYEQGIWEALGGVALFVSTFGYEIIKSWTESLIQSDKKHDPHTHNDKISLTGIEDKTEASQQKISHSDDEGRSQSSLRRRQVRTIH